MTRAVDVAEVCRPDRLRLATRASQQALAQSRAVATALETAGVEVELITVQTTGDQRADVPLHTMGGQGVFVKEVQRAVLDGRADLAVHSAKDLPSTTEPGLVIAAFCTRRSAADALIGRRLAQLATGATIASGSVRRRAQLVEVRPDLRFVELRGNIASRLDKIPPEGSIVMAVAALEVLGRTDLIAETLDPTLFVPAVGQGCVAVECRAEDRRTRDVVASVDDPVTRAAVVMERAFLAELGSGCSLPIGAHATATELFTFLSGPRGTFRETVSRDADPDTDQARARELARRGRDAVS